MMDPLDLLFDRLVRAARDKRPELLSHPFEVAELIELVPYRAVRAEGAVETNDDYSHALTRLLAGERGYLFVDDLMQDDLRAELSSPNPDLTAWRAYTAARVTISQEHARRSGEAVSPAQAGGAAPEATPAATARPPRHWRNPSRDRSRSPRRDSRHASSRAGTAQSADPRTEAGAAPEPGAFAPARSGGGDRPARVEAGLPLLRPGAPRGSPREFLPELRTEPARPPLRRVQRRAGAGLEILRGVRPPGRVLTERSTALMRSTSSVRLRLWRPAPAAVLALGLLATIAAAPCAAQLPGASMQSVSWPLRTREHVDLWLHGFAMISSDTSPVPLFRRGYREALLAARTKANAVTDLDVKRDVLAKRLRENPALVNAQFLAFSFATWDELAAAIDTFAKADGDPKKARSRESAAVVAMLARVFPSKADRDFARTLANALQNEKDVFFHAWWVEEMRRRERTLAAVDSTWHRGLQPRLQGFLNHSEQPAGDLILSLALEGEGRTVSDPRGRTQVAVGFPDSPEHAMDAMYEFAHEIVGPLTGPAVEDNTTPAEKRSGTATAIGSYALVRGGALVMERLSPDLAAGYARFYLRVGGVAFDGDPMIALVRAFPIPRPMLESIDRQVSICFGGI